MAATAGAAVAADQEVPDVMVLLGRAGHYATDYAVSFRPVIAQEHILSEKDGRERWTAHVAALTKAFALCPTEPYAMEIRDDVAFFQIVACHRFWPITF